MAEPNYAYNPAVASWVQSMSLAGIEEQELEPDQGHHQAHHHQGLPTDDTPDSPSPVDYYKSAYTPAPEHDVAAGPIPAPPLEMNVTRQRQNTASSNTVRSPPRTGPRSVSGPASSVASSRSPPRQPGRSRPHRQRCPGAPSAAPAARTRRSG